MIIVFCHHKGNNDKMMMTQGVILFFITIDAMSQMRWVLYFFRRALKEAKIHFSVLEISLVLS